MTVAVRRVCFDRHHVCDPLSATIACLITKCNTRAVNVQGAWPCDIVVGSQTLAKYNKILRLLLQIGYVRWALVHMPVLRTAGMGGWVVCTSI